MKSSILAFLYLLGACSPSAAFVAPSFPTKITAAAATTTRRPRRQQRSVAFSSATAEEGVDIDEEFYKAVQEASKTITASDKTMEEWDRLATALEEYAEGARYEKDSADLGEKEIQDRFDVADILRLKIELQLR